MVGKFHFSAFKQMPMLIKSCIMPKILKLFLCACVKVKHAKSLLSVKKLLYRLYAMVVYQRVFTTLYDL